MVLSCELVWVEALAVEILSAWLAMTMSDCFGVRVGYELSTP